MPTVGDDESVRSIESAIEERISLNINNASAQRAFFFFFFLGIMIILLFTRFLLSSSKAMDRSANDVSHFLEFAFKRHPSLYFLWPSACGCLLVC